jgi:PIN domain nuclease of toxin-antitoxin system
MAYLIDTHIFIAVAKRRMSELPKSIRILLEEEEPGIFFSVASIWEIGIKVRLGKLDAGMEPSAIESYCTDVGITILPITAVHATQALEREPSTRDPFDRMLLAQCAAENMRLVTIDRALAEHPLAVS